MDVRRGPWSHRWSGGCYGVGGEVIENIRGQVGDLYHREVTAGNLNRLHAEEFGGDESLPLRRENSSSAV